MERQHRPKIKLKDAPFAMNTSIVVIEECKIHRWQTVGMDLLADKVRWPQHHILHKMEVFAHKDSIVLRHSLVHKTVLMEHTIQIQGDQIAITVQPVNYVLEINSQNQEIAQSANIVLHRLHFIITRNWTVQLALLEVF